MRRGERMVRGVRIEVWINSRRGGMKKTAVQTHIYNEQMREKKRVQIYSYGSGFPYDWHFKEKSKRTFVQDKIAALRLHTDSKSGCSCFAGLWLTFGPYCNLIWPRAAYLHRKRLSDHFMWTSQDKNKPRIFLLE